MSADPLPRLLRHVDPRDLLDSAAQGYAQSLTRLWAARDALADAYARGDRLARGRAALQLWTATADADGCHDALQSAAAAVARSREPGAAA